MFCKILGERKTLYENAGFLISNINIYNFSLTFNTDELDILGIFDLIIFIETVI